jgi:hypothetical protein
MGAACDNELKSYVGGSIFVEMLSELGVGFEAGQVIQGVVHVNQTENFQAHYLMVGIRGFEFVQFKKAQLPKQGSNEITYQTYSGEREIINISWPLAYWQDGLTYAGHYSYPFTMQLPEWLPASVVMVNNQDWSRMEIRYIIEA